MLYKYKRIQILARVLAILYILSTIGTIVVFASPSKIDLDKEQTVANTDNKNIINTPILFTDIEYKVFYDIADSTNYIYTIQESMKSLETAIYSTDYSKEAQEVMTGELSRLSNIQTHIEVDIQNYSKWENEYYYAAKVYEYLMKNGFSKEVTCGIIGNMMVECGGHTLKLNPFAYSASRKYYGLCQWSTAYGLHGSSFEFQLEYLTNSIEGTFRSHAWRYKSGFTYEDFLTMKDPAQAALAFTKIYERCSSSSYSIRQTSALNAYKYFEHIQGIE